MTNRVGYAICVVSRKFNVALVVIALLVVSVLRSFAIDLVAGYGARNTTVEAWINQGCVKVLAGDLVAARARFDAAIQAEPKFWPAYHDRAVVSVREEKWELALRDLDTSMRLHPKNLGTALLRAEVKRQLGRYNDCLTELSQILKIHLTDTTSASVFDERARLRATCPDASFRNGKLAVADAKLACRLSRWQNPRYVDALALAYAEAGDFDSAVKYEERAMAIVQAKPKQVVDAADVVKSLEERIARFKRHEPPHS